MVQELEIVTEREVLCALGVKETFVYISELNDIREKRASAAAHDRQKPDFWWGL
jgi:hypothetical protein